MAIKLYCCYGFLYALALRLAILSMSVMHHGWNILPSMYYSDLQETLVHGDLETLTLCN